MHLPPLEKFLVAIQTATLIGLSFHMWRAELHRVYINFFRYLLLALFDAIPLTIVTYGTTAYGYVWMATEALTLCFYALIVLECYATVFRNLGGIASISRRYIKVTVVVAALAAVLLAGLEKTPKTVFQYFYALDRGVVSTLLLFVLFITLFLVYYPIPLNRNVIVYSVGYAVYFLTKAVALFVRNIGDQRQPQVSAILIAI
jgi:flagellar biosynthesis protein FlhB